MRRLGSPAIHKLLERINAAAGLGVLVVVKMHSVGLRIVPGETVVIGAA